MKKFFLLPVLCLASLLLVACDDESAVTAADTGNELVQTVSDSKLAYLEGYENAAMGYTTLVPEKLAKPIYIKDYQLKGESYLFLKTNGLALGQMTEFPTSSGGFVSAAEIELQNTYWVMYRYRYFTARLKLRIGSINGNTVGLEYVVMDVHSADLSINENANIVSGSVEGGEADILGLVKQNLEMPRINVENTFVAHFSTIEGEQAVNYSLEWNQAMKHAQWAAFSFDKNTSKYVVERTDNFVVDPDLPTEMQVDNSYHTSDGFDRGHICASRDRSFSAEANAQTFYFSNMSPQLAGFNSGIWQDLEAQVQEWGALTKNGTYDKVYVAKGGTLNQLLLNFKGTIPGNDKVLPTTDADGLTVKGLPCPKYYYMAVLSEHDGDYNAIGFYLEHKDTYVPSNGTKDVFTAPDFKVCTVSISKLEELTGEDFFCNLPDEIEKVVESEVDLDSWKW